MAQTGNKPWWRLQMETFSALLALCAGNSPVTGEFPTQTPVTRSFGASFDLRLNKRLGKQSWGWWFETQSRSLWRQCNVIISVGWCKVATISCSGYWSHPKAHKGNKPRSVLRFDKLWFIEFPVSKIDAVLFCLWLCCCCSSCCLVFSTFLTAFLSCVYPHSSELLHW